MPPTAGSALSFSQKIERTRKSFHFKPSPPIYSKNPPSSNTAYRKYFPLHSRFLTSRPLPILRSMLAFRTSLTIANDSDDLESSDDGSSDQDTDITAVEDDEHHTLSAKDATNIKRGESQSTPVVLRGKILHCISSFESLDAEMQEAPHAEVDATPTLRDTFPGPNSDYENEIIVGMGLDQFKVSPLHHKGLARGRVVYEPEGMPGLCPIHRCSPCGPCENEGPVIYEL